ncbi:hypothetical protein NIES4071_03820 [Calothrix sp. NIES-4071]|nr:hypothetical protein NIES4071_03820 [Calothrix sp. NIES-4071]BAZ54728.1 hypothetical protein NIES4105_03810 [Calothrix sp. NIES-4105]
MSQNSKCKNIFHTFISIFLIIGSNALLPSKALQQSPSAKTYQNLIQNLIYQFKYDSALVISERSRERALIEVTNNRGTISSENKPPSPNIAKIKQIAKQQNATIVQYSVLHDSTTVNGKQETRESELYIWVIKSTGEIKFSQVDLKPLWQQKTSLTELIKSSRTAISTRDNLKGMIITGIKKSEDSQYKQLQTIHTLLIEPIAGSLPKNKSEKVIFIPQSTLFLVPFAALQDAKGKYLIEQHAISISPSIQALDLLHSKRQKQAKTQDILIVGNPETASISFKPGEAPQKLVPLPGAEQQVKAIATIFNTKAFIGKQATKATVLERMPKAKIIHLATNTFDIQESSVIALAPSSNDNGLLTVEEISKLQLNAELVVLSSCNTALGKITSDGVIGYERAFMTAGVPSLIGSLWDINDEATILLMTQFYKNLFTNHNKPQALQQAMLTTKQKYPNPRDWAGFTFTGDTL